MPITFDKKAGFEIKDPTPEEINAYIEIGKGMIVQGLSHAYTNEKYKQFLIHEPNWRYWKV